MHACSMAWTCALYAHGMARRYDNRAKVQDQLPFLAVARRCRVGTVQHPRAEKLLVIWRPEAMLRGLLLLSAVLIAAGSVCERGKEYCCPDAKHCLTPTAVTCRESGATCGADEVCCPLTKLCVKVGKPCQPTCADAYCCPGGLHCVRPTRPGVRCSKNETGGESPCWPDEECCGITNVCIKSTGASCTPP